MNTEDKDQVGARFRKGRLRQMVMVTKETMGSRGRAGADAKDHGRRRCAQEAKGVTGTDARGEGQEALHARSSCRVGRGWGWVRTVAGELRAPKAGSGA